MRQRQVGQAQRFVARRLQAHIDAVGPTDHERHVAPVAEPEAQALGQLRGAAALAALVEHDPARPFGEFLQYRFDALGLRGHQRARRLAAAARLGLHRLQLEPAFAREAFGELVEGRLGPGRLALADRDQHELHAVLRAFRLGGAFLAGARLAGPRSDRP